MTNPGISGRTAPARGWFILLGLSLAVNLLLAGFLLGRWVEGGAPMRAMPHHMEWALRGLTQEERTALRTRLGGQMRESRRAFQRVRKAQRAVWQLVKTEPLDEAALQEALARLRQESASSQAHMHEALLGILKQLEPEQRRRVMEALSSRHPRHGRAHRGPEKTERQLPPPEAGR